VCIENDNYLVGGEICFDECSENNEKVKFITDEDDEPSFVEEN